MQIEISQARKIFHKLLKAAEQGEVVTFCRDGIPVADMIRTKEPRAYVNLKKRRRNPSPKQT
jgi:antitoxin (DNA-binding transcriptional repressor) of toxin-antitoxin stability system